MMNNNMGCWGGNQCAQMGGSWPQGGGMGNGMGAYGGNAGCMGAMGGCGGNMTAGACGGPQAKRQRTGAGEDEDAW